MRTVQLEEDLLELLGGVEIVPRRMLLDTGTVKATVPMLRGVWGRALRNLDMDAYATVFEGRTGEPGRGTARVPLYMVRPAPPDPATSPAIDWMLFGDSIRFQEAMVRAWDVASGMGLGPKREPFRIRAVRWLDTQSFMTSRVQRWSLREAAAALENRGFARGPLRVEFNVPLRILRKGKLIETPTFVDVVVALLRRTCLLGGIDPREAQGRHGDFVKAVTSLAKRMPAGAWEGRRTDFVRWSGAQHKEVDMHGVIGSLRLPSGAGDFWPLLVAGSWIHVGRGAVFGLGQVELAVDGTSE